MTCEGVWRGVGKAGSPAHPSEDISETLERSLRWAGSSVMTLYEQYWKLDSDVTGNLIVSSASETFMPQCLCLPVIRHWPAFLHFLPSWCSGYTGVSLQGRT